jgi:hypothetical protein
MFIYDKETQFVELIVYDYDVGMAPDFLGKLTLNLDTIPSKEIKELDLSLSEVETGTIQLVCVYTPLVQQNQKSSLPTNKSSSQADSSSSKVFYKFGPKALETDDFNTIDHCQEIERKASVAPTVTDIESSPTKAARESSRLSRKICEIGGVLTLRDMYATNMKGHLLLSPLKPYIVFTIGETKYPTAVHKVLPDFRVNFDETINVPIQDPLHSTISIKVFF